MADCKHVLGQGFNIQYMMEYVYCINCKKKWSKEEVTKCLNATECLSAEDAENIAGHIETTYKEFRGMWETSLSEQLYEKLKTYSRMLEGKDD